MSPSWFDGVAPATARVDCRGERHRIEWSEGRLTLGDHPADDATSCPCTEIRDAWARHSRDPEVLLLGPRDRHLPGDSRRALVLAQRRARLRRLPGEAARDGDGLEALLRLEGALPYRLVATVAAALSEREDDPSLAPMLYAALYGRSLATLRHWIRTVSEFQLEMTDGEPELERRSGTDHGGLLVARLPFRWIAEVWGRELDVVGERFTLAAAPDPVGGWRLLGVDHAMNVNACTLPWR